MTLAGVIRHAPTMPKGILPDPRTVMLVMRARPQQKSRVPRPIRLPANRSPIVSQWVMARRISMNSGATLMIASATSLAAKKAQADLAVVGMVNRIQTRIPIMAVAAHRAAVHVPPFFQVDCLSHPKMGSWLRLAVSFLSGLRPAFL